MYGIFTNIHPINGPNVGKYTIHGAYGLAACYFAQHVADDAARCPGHGSRRPHQLRNARRTAGEHFGIIQRVLAKQWLGF